MICAWSIASFGKDLPMSDLENNELVYIAKE